MGWRRVEPNIKINTAKELASQRGLQVVCLVRLGYWVELRLRGVSLSLGDYLSQQDNLTVVQKFLGSDRPIPDNLEIGNTSQLRPDYVLDSSATRKERNSVLCKLGAWVIYKIRGGGLPLTHYLSQNNQVELIRNYMAKARISLEKRSISKNKITILEEEISRAKKESEEQQILFEDLMKQFAPEFLELREKNPEKFNNQYFADLLSKVLEFEVKPLQVARFLNQNSPKKRRKRSPKVDSEGGG